MSTPRMHFSAPMGPIVCIGIIAVGSADIGTVQAFTRANYVRDLLGDGRILTKLNAPSAPRSVIRCISTTPDQWWSN